MDGQQLKTHPGIVQEVVGFYISLLGKVDKHVSGSSVSELRDILSYRVSAEHKSALLREVSIDEIKAALWSIDDNSASGPNGYNSHFFKLVGALLVLTFSKLCKVSLLMLICLLLSTVQLLLWCPRFPIRLILRSFGLLLAVMLFINALQKYW